MIDKPKFFGLMCLLSIVRLQAQDISYLESAYKDEMFLFVEENAKELLTKDEILKQPELALRIEQLWVASLVKREKYAEALEKVMNIVVKSPDQKLDVKLEFYKAIAAFYVYTKTEQAMPEGMQPPHVILEQIESQLSFDEQFVSKYYRAYDMYEMGQYNLAFELLNTFSISSAPVEIAEQVQFLVARSLFYSNPPEYEKSLQNLKELIEKYKKSNEMHRYLYWRGQCFFELNQLENAEMAFKQALEHHPDSKTEVDIHHNLGWLYSSLGNLEKASEHLKLLLDPKWKEISFRYEAPTRYKLANMMFFQNQVEQAFDTVLPVLNDPALRYNASLLAGRAKMAMGAWSDASEYLIEALSSPLRAIKLEAGRNLGEVYLQLKQYDLAIGSLKGLIESEVLLDFRIQIQLDIAKVYFEMGDIYLAQNIYRELLTEQNKSIEAGVYYNLAKCATMTNPLVECFFKRDQLVQKLEMGRIDRLSFETENSILSEEVKGVLSRIWIMANSGSTELNKGDVIKKLAELCEADVEAMTQVIRADYLKEHEDLPSELGEESMLLNELVIKFDKVFKDLEKIPSYQSSIELLMPLSRVYEKLQTMLISNQLDHVISMGKQSPYLALAYHDKAKLFNKQNLLGVALESLHHAIASTTDPSLKSQYLLELTDIQINIAESLGEKDDSLGAKKEKGVKAVDAKTQKFKVKQGLKNLDEILRLGYVSHVDVVERKHRCYLILLDIQSAEHVLLDFLAAEEPKPDKIVIENLLIEFYLNQGMNKKAGHQRLLHATRVQDEDGINADKHRYLAALELIAQDDEGKKSGMQILEVLINVDEKNHWTYKAILKQVEMMQKMGSTEKAAALLDSIKEGKAKNVPEALEQEWNMVHGRLAMEQKDYQIATQYFQHVFTTALPKHEIKAVAMLEYANALSFLDQHKAADVYLQFYYLFSDHSKREDALLKSCQLRLMFIHNHQKNDMKIEAVEQLKQLIAKIDNDSERVRLLNEVKGL